MAGFSARKFRTRVAAGCGLVMAAGVLVAVTRPAFLGFSPGSPYGTSVGTGIQQGSAPSWRQTDGAGVSVVPARSMPAGGQAVVRVGGPAADVGGVEVRIWPAGTRLTAAASPAAAAPVVLVRVLGQRAARAAGVPGVVVALSPGGGAAGQMVRASFDYGSFANAYGADFGRRLRLFSLPGCALTTPAVPACQVRTLVPGGVNVWPRVVADLALGPARAGAGRGAVVGGAAATVVALASVSYSSSGTFTATSLSEAYNWSAGNQGGTFSTSVPLKVPASLGGGPAPRPGLAYDSGGVDAETLSQNSQPSWAGEGWDLQTGYIERAYRTCSVAGGTFPNTPDPCLYSPNDVTMVFGGRSVRLVWNSTTSTWHASDDTALKIEQLNGTGAANAPGSNGTHDDLYWRVTTLDGTRYYFGINYRYAGDTAATNSAQYETVYQSGTGQECQTTVRNWCWLGYRWNLDYVVDPSGNSMTYFYNQFTGRVGAANDTNNEPYALADTLDHVDYGTRAGSESAASAPMRVVFTRANRCINACAQTASDYPDTPWDLYCSSTTSCPSTLSPVYFTPYKLAAVTTQVRTGTAYRNVDKWDMAYTFPATDTSPALWLSTVTHTGYAADGTTTLAEPAVTFNGTKLANRVDYNLSAGVPELQHYRLTQILNGMGGETDIGYNPAQCTTATATALTGHADSNPYLCFPQYFKPSGAPAGWGWFQKYTAASVTLKDLTGGSPDEVYSYAYSLAGSAEPTALAPSTPSMPALWHHDYNDSADPAASSWSHFNGFSTVTVTHGAAGGPQTVTKSLYYRGMSGDNYASGALRTVTLTDSQASGITDSQALQGQLLEQTQMDGTAAASSRISTYAITQTAHRAVSGSGPDWYANLVTTTKAQNRTWIAATSSWRWTETDTTYNSYGLPTLVKDLGDTSVPAQARCTTTSYVTPDTTKWLISFPAQQVTTDCAATLTDADYLSGKQWYYDGNATNGATPTTGLVTTTKALASVTGGVLAWAPASTAAYDANGRVTDSGDAIGRHTLTAYTPASGGPVTAVTTTSPSPMNWTTVTNIEPGHGSVTSVVDVNGKATTASYDPLGRLTQVWLNNQPVSATPDRQYTYTLSNTAANSVETQALSPAGAQIASYSIYDGQLRPRQVQSPVPAANGGRWITDTAYDSRGLTAKTSAFYNNASGPSGSLATFTDAAVPTQHRYTYDNLGRQTADAFWSLGVQEWQTTSSYDGDRTGVIPPAGGITQQTLTDARGNVIELRQFASASLTSAYQSTFYAYDRLGHLTKVTDSQNNTWTWAYDLRGRQTAASTPDTGTTTSSYDDAGQLTSSTDARNITLAYSYDNLGRKTGTYLTSTSGTQLSGWTYDTLAKGQLTSSTQYTAGNAYTTAVTGYDDAYRPLGTSVTIPAAEGTALAGTWTTSTTYNVDGSGASIGYPAAGGLPAETVSYGYDVNGYLLTSAGADTYVSASSYQPWGDIYQRMLGTGTSRVQVTTDQWPDTHRVKTISVGTEHPGTPGTFDEQLTQQYNWSPAGTLTSVDSQHAGATTDSQCFGYDNLRRLTTAFTTTPALGGCATAPSATTVGGPDAYWQTYAYDPGGNRTTLIAHGLAGAGDTTSTYTYPAPATAGAHTLSSVATTSPGGTASSGYTYLPAGQLSNMTISGLSTDFTYTPQGAVATAATHAPGGDQTATYIYDAAGTELLRDTATGKTLYLGGTEITADPAGATITGATRYYTAGGATIASRNTTTGLSWLASDDQGTAQIAITQATLAVSIRKQDPFGNPRGTIPNWPNSRGFVGGTPEPDGLIHLGARMYDAVTGRFTSHDPVLNTSDPQQLNGYAYAANNPATSSDPSGLCPVDRCGTATVNANQMFIAQKSQVIYWVSQAANYAQRAKAAEGRLQADLATVSSATDWEHCPSCAVSRFFGFGTPSLSSIYPPGVVRQAIDQLKADIAAVEKNLSLSGSDIARARAAIAAAVDSLRAEGVPVPAADAINPADLYTGPNLPIYRGVPTDHIFYNDATQGTARPGDPGGTADVWAHNGADTVGSRLTSWSTELQMASDYARQGGVTLRTTIGELQARGINVLESPDSFGEGEVLVEGVVDNLEVLP